MYVAVRAFILSNFDLAILRIVLDKWTLDTDHFGWSVRSAIVVVLLCWVSVAFAARLCTGVSDASARGEYRTAFEN